MRQGLKWGLALAGLMALPLIALAQETDPAAPMAKLSIGQQIAVEDGDLIGIMPVDLILRTGTRVQTLQFSLSAPFRLNDPDESSTFALGDPQARLLMRRGARNSAIEAELGYRENDLDNEILYDAISNEFVIVDNGRVAQTDARLTYVFGREAKLGGELGLFWLARDYSGTTDPDLDDTQTRRGNVVIYLEPTPLIRARILAETTRTTGDTTDSRTDRWGAGASMQVDKVTNLNTELAQAYIRRLNNNGVIEETRGLSLRLGLTRSRPLGDWSLSLSSDPGTAGRRESFYLGRTLKLPRQDFSARIGVTRFQGSYDPVFQIAYSRQVGRLSQFQASLRRAEVTDDDGDQALNTEIAANYSHQITAVSSIAANVRYRDSTVQTGDKEDAQSVSFGLNYSRALPNDFSLVAGVSVIRSEDSNKDSNDEERIYVGVNRSFNFLP